MAARILVDAGFLVALLARRDTHHDWAATEARRLPPPWCTCEAALSEAFYLLGASGSRALAALLSRSALATEFEMQSNLRPVLALMEKYRTIPVSLADACLIRMTEIIPEPLLITTDTDFLVYRRHGRQVIPCVTPY